jgi:transposase, IS5 family
MDIWYPCFMQKSFVTQAELFVSSSDLEHPALHALDATEAVLEWSKIEPILSSVYASQTGRPSYPLLTLFRGLLLGVWYWLLGEINRQLEAKSIILTQGRITIIDATPVEAAQSGSGKGKGGQPKRDRQAGWHVKKDSRGNLKSTYGYSVHTGVDEDGFYQRRTVTAGNVHDSVERDTLLLGDETALYADAAYSSKETRDKLERFGIADQVQRKGL